MSDELFWLAGGVVLCKAVDALASRLLRRLRRRNAVYGQLAQVVGPLSFFALALILVAGVLKKALDTNGGVGATITAEVVLGVVVLAVVLAVLVLALRAPKVLLSGTPDNLAGVAKGADDPEVDEPFPEREDPRESGPADRWDGVPEEIERILAKARRAAEGRMHQEPMQRAGQTKPEPGVFERRIYGMFEEIAEDLSRLNGRLSRKAKERH